jgi:hypothetical protein
MKTAIAAAGALLALAVVNPAAAQSRAEVGMLECNVSGGVGFIFGSTRSMGCTFNMRNRAPEFYTGKINRYGVDIGFTGSAVLIWQVLASTSQLGPHALAGKYVGVGADASLGAGLGANALIGGSNRTVALQPIQVEAKTGINIAAGIAEIELVPAQ